MRAERDLMHSSLLVLLMRLGVNCQLCFQCVYGVLGDFYFKPVSSISCVVLTTDFIWQLTRFASFFFFQENCPHGCIWTSILCWSSADVKLCHRRGNSRTFLCYYSSLLRPSRSQLSWSHKEHMADPYFLIFAIRKAWASHLSLLLKPCFSHSYSHNGKGV